jgi:hypothetical protein
MIRENITESSTYSTGMFEDASACIEPAVFSHADQDFNIWALITFTMAKPVIFIVIGAIGKKNTDELAHYFAKFGFPDCNREK